MSVIFIVCYSNYHLVFSMKYWTLALKIESLMHQEQQISNRTKRTVSVLFWGLEAIVLTIAFISILGVYQVLPNSETQ